MSERREPITDAPPNEALEPDRMPDHESPSESARERIPLAIFWFVIVAALLLFIAFGTVALHYSGAHPKLTAPDHERIIRVWLDQADRLPRAGANSLVHALYFLTFPIILIGTAVAMWLALIAKPDHDAEDSAAPAWDAIEAPFASAESDAPGERG